MDTLIGADALVWRWLDWRVLGLGAASNLPRAAAHGELGDDAPHDAPRDRAQRFDGLVRPTGAQRLRAHRAALGVGGVARSEAALGVNTPFR